MGNKIPNSPFLSSTSRRLRSSPSSRRKIAINVQHQPFTLTCLSSSQKARLCSGGCPRTEQHSHCSRFVLLLCNHLAVTSLDSGRPFLGLESPTSRVLAAAVAVPSSLPPSHAAVASEVAQSRRRSKFANAVNRLLSEQPRITNPQPHIIIRQPRTAPETPRKISSFIYVQVPFFLIVFHLTI